MADTMFQLPAKRGQRKSIPIRMDNLRAARENRERVALAQADEYTAYEPVPEEARQLLGGHYRKRMAAIRNWLKKNPSIHAEDVMHDVYVRALRYWDTYDGKRPLGAWMHSIAVNLRNDQDRARDAQFMDDRFNGLTPQHARQDFVVKLTELQDRLEREPEERRAVLSDYLVMGLSSREIANILPVSEGNVRQIVHRFRQSLDEYS